MSVIFITEIVLLAIAVILQLKSFNHTAGKIREMRDFFPLESQILIRTLDGKQYANIVKVADAKLSSGFTKVILNINRYLDKSRGSVEGALGIVNNIISREKNKIEEEIESQLSGPLYIGLGATLIGIIFGIYHLTSATAEVDIAELSNEAVNGLFKSVMFAVGVSLIGLILVIINTNYNYKTAKLQSGHNEGDILSKIEIELLPTVTDSTASAIYSLRENLTKFNYEFGKNLNSYKDNFGMINDNLKSQERVLQLLSKNNLAETAKELAVILKDVGKVASNFKIYQDYQLELIESFDKTRSITDNYNETLESFEDFNEKLTDLGTYVESQTTFNKQFQQFLENNFPDDQSAKEIYNQQWREIGNKLIKDIAVNSAHVTNYFDSVNSEMTKFSKNNSSFFESFAGFKNTIDVLIKNSEMSYKAFDMTHQNMQKLHESVQSQSKNISELTKTIKSSINNQVTNE